MNKIQSLSWVVTTARSRRQEEQAMRGPRIFGLVLAVVTAFILLRAVSSDAAVGSITTLAIDPDNPATIYAGTGGGGVFKSTNGGDNWSATALTNSGVNALVIDPGAPSTLYAAANGTVYKSTNGGASWNATGPTGFGVYSLAIDPATPTTPTTLYAGSNGAVLTSADGGASWS